ncbi:hypothetical protein [Streptomyces sp. NPDC060031]|uniref:hypothetical protein n=1 Tax=Streptomyces sp. NPDC060031 TaxID=3347043 RepID=UPI00367A8206
MAPQSFVTEWNAVTGVLEAELASVPVRSGSCGSSGENSVDFQAVAAVSFTSDGGVCAVNVPDIPDHVLPAIPPASGEETVGLAWLDSGWLWIPLSHEQVARRRSGLAHIELRLNEVGVTGVVLRFVDQEMTT